MHSGKRKYRAEEEEAEGEEIKEDEDMDPSTGKQPQMALALLLLCNHVSLFTDESLRSNAILLQGTPISNLPTSNIFAYVGHYDVKPIGLEWIDDTTCVLVFETKRAAVASHARLLGSGEEEPDVFGLSAAQPIPPGVLPPRSQSGDDAATGDESDLFGGIRMRWARKDDVKQKGAKNQSRFYQRHGETAGKDGRGFFDDPPPKRKRTRTKRGRKEADDEIRARLDQELEAFAAGEETPLSKMRSDNMEGQGRSAVVIELPKPEGQRRPQGGNARPRKSQQELDDELDAFLRGKE